jgi:ATP:ADP antiporter, AAA family
VRTSAADTSGAARQAIAVAALMMAWQVAAKATRDGLFLSVFSPGALPAIVAASAISSILLALVSAKLLHRYGPFRLIPAGFLAGGLLHGAEWLLFAAAPRLISALIYIHVIALGAVLLSGFWAIVNERFDPRAARRRFGHITAFGTLGSLAGGLAAERVVALASSADLLLLLMGLQLACGLILMQSGSHGPAEKTTRPVSIPEVLSGAPYLIGLAVLVLLVAMSAGALDYLFKFQSVLRFGKGPTLSRFFALFYATCSVITFLIQLGASRYWLKRVSPGRTVLALPVTVAGASFVSLFAPGALALIVARGLEQVLKGALFRSGYELFYTPMPPAEKRATKSVIDIGADRLGDGLAAGAIQILLSLPAAISTRLIIGSTVAFSCLAAWVALRLDRAYVGVLEKGLTARAPRARPEEVEDLLSKSMLSQSFQGILAVQKQPQPAARADVSVERLTELRSGDPGRVRAALRQEGAPDYLLAAQMIQLLGWDEVAKDAHAALLKMGGRIAGQLADALSDATADFQVRKRIPRILALCQSRLAWDGLFGNLCDERFEIRYRCGKALEQLLQKRPEYRPDANAIFAIAAQELAFVQQLPDAPAAASGDSERNVGRVLRERSSRSMTHLCSLLSLVLPPKSVGLAFQALRSGDTKLRGVALEYLDSVLPSPLGEQLCAHVEAPRPERKSTASEEALANLDDLSPSIIARVWEVDYHSPRKPPPAGGSTESEGQS